MTAKKIVDEELILKLASIGCTQSEIATMVGLSESGISKNYKHLIFEGRANLKMTLRRKQIEVAVEGKGNPTMLIWLGKNILDQTDKQETKIDITKVEQLKEALNNANEVVKDDDFQTRRKKFNLNK